MEENKMCLTVVDIDEVKLWDGAKVIRLKDKKRLLMKPYDFIKDRIINGKSVRHLVAIDTVLLNKHLFELINS